MAIKVKDLQEQINTSYPRPLLFCTKCRAEYSANRGDYFSTSPEYVFKCCGRNMLLVTKRTAIEEVRA